MKYLILILFVFSPLLSQAQSYGQEQCENLATNLYIDIGHKGPPVFNEVPTDSGVFWGFKWYGDRYSLTEITDDIIRSFTRQGAVSIPHTFKTAYLDSGQHQIIGNYLFNGVNCAMVITTPDTIIISYSERHN